MKFTIFTQAALAISFITGVTATPAGDMSASEVKRANCKLEVNYANNWVESGLDRYRGHLITTPRNDYNADLFCNRWKNSVGALTVNPQCGWVDGAIYVDGSYARGPAGQRAWIDSVQGTLSWFRTITGCDTDNRL